MNFRTCTLMPPQYIGHNTSSASLILRPEDKSSSDGKPFLRVVPTRGWQSPLESSAPGQGWFWDEILGEVCTAAACGGRKERRASFVSQVL